MSVVPPDGKSCGTVMAVSAHPGAERMATGDESQSPRGQAFHLDVHVTSGDGQNWNQRFASVRRE